MNKIDQSIAALAAISGEADTPEVPSGLAPAFDLLDRGSLDEAVAALGRWLAAQKPGEETARGVASFEIVRARKTRELGDFGAAAAILGRIDLRSAPMAVFCEEAAAIWNNNRDHRFVAALLASALRCGRFAEMGQCFGHCLGSETLRGIVDGVSPADTAILLKPLKPALIAEIGGDRSWQILGWFYERLRGAEASRAGLQQTVKALELAVAAGRPRQDIVRLLGLIGTFYNPTTNDIAAADFLTNALASAVSCLGAADAAKPEGGLPSDIDLAVAIANSSDPADLLAVTRALWLALAKPLERGGRALPPALAGCIEELARDPGPQRDEAALLRDLAAAKNRRSSKRDFAVPKLQLAYLDLRETDQAIAAGNSGAAQRHLSRAREHGAAAAVCLVRLAAIAALSRRQDDFLSALSVSGPPGVAATVLHGVLDRYGADLACEVASLLPETALREQAFWKTPPMAEKSGGGGAEVLATLLARLLKLSDLPAATAAAAVKRQIVVLPRDRRAEFFKPALLLLAKVPKDGPAAGKQVAAAAIARLLTEFSTSGDDQPIGNEALMALWRQATALVQDEELLFGCAAVLIRGPVAPEAKTEIAGALMPALLDAARRGDMAGVNERHLAGLAAAARNKERFLEFVSLRSAAGHAAAYARPIRDEIDQSIRERDLTCARRLAALLESAGLADGSDGMRSIVLDLLEPSAQQSNAVLRIPGGAFLQFIDKSSAIYGAEHALNALAAASPALITNASDWKRLGERPHPFDGRPELVEGLLDRIEDAGVADLGIYRMLARIAFSVLDPERRLLAFERLVAAIETRAGEQSAISPGLTAEAINGIVEQYHLAVSGALPDLDGCAVLATSDRAGGAFVRYYRSAVAWTVEKAASIDDALAAHARTAAGMPRPSDNGLHSNVEDIYLLAAAGDTKRLRDRLANATFHHAGQGKGDAELAVVALFCLKHANDASVRDCALDLLWSAAPVSAEFLVFAWEAQPQRVFDAVNRLSKANRLVPTILAAAEALPPARREGFFDRLPLDLLRRKREWASKDLAAAAKRRFDGAYAFVSYLADKSAGAAPESVALLEVAAKALLSILSSPQNFMLAARLRSCLAKWPPGTRSATLSKALRPFSSAKDLETIAVKAFGAGDRRTAITVIEAAALGRLNAARAAKYFDMLIELGAVDQAEALLALQSDGQTDLDTLRNRLRLSMIRGEEAKISAAALSLFGKGRSVSPRKLDAAKAQLLALPVSKPLRRVISRVYGAAEARRRLDHASAALQAKLALNDEDGARKVAAGVPRSALLGPGLEEIGLHVLVGDFKSAETSLAAIIERELRRQRILSRIRQPARLRTMDRALEFAHLVQRYFLNEGRDVTFLPRLELLVLSALNSPWKHKLSSIAVGRLFTVGLAALRMRLRSTEPEHESMAALCEALSGFLTGRVDRQIRMSHILLQGWQPDGGRLVEEAIGSINGEMRGLLAGGKARAAASSEKSASQKAFEQQRASGFPNLDLKQTLALAKLVNTGLNLSNQHSAYAVFDDLLLTARNLITHGSVKKWFKVPGLQSLARRVHDIVPDVPEALDFLIAADDPAIADSKYLSLMASTLVASGNSGEALEFVNRGLAVFPNNRSLLRSAIQIHANIGNAAAARENAARLAALVKVDALFGLDQPGLVRDCLDLKNTLAQLNFWSDTSKVMALRPAPRLSNPKGVVFASFYKCMASASISTIPLLELKKRGFDVVYLNAGTVDAEATGHDCLDRFRGILQADGSVVSGLHIPSAKLLADWTVDWDDRKIAAEGLNFYQPIFERLTQLSRTYSIDVEDPQVGRQTKGMIRLFDRALHVAKRIRAEVCEKGIPVRFVSSNWQYPPYAAFRIICEAWKGACDIGFVAVSPGYESYYANLGKRYATTAAAVNMTANSDSRAPFLPVKRKFDAWLAANGSRVSKVDDEVKGWIATDRAGVGNDIPAEARAVLDRVKRFREAGGKVIGVFGKIVYDLAVPYAGGPAHTDMKDFINHTVASAAKSNALVLIKPHPHELRFEIARNPREYFTDMIEVDIPQNVMLLGHRWFNVRDMIGMIDLGVLWNGTTGVELGASGIPVVMCDDWGPRDYPVGHFTPRDRQHYEQIIADPSIVTMPVGYPEKCAALLKYLSTDDVMRPYPFVRRGLVNVDVGPPVWDFAEVDRYLKDGDRYVSALADDFMFPD